MRVAGAKHPDAIISLESTQVKICCKVEHADLRIESFAIGGRNVALEPALSRADFDLVNKVRGVISNVISCKARRMNDSEVRCRNRRAILPALTTAVVS